MADDTNVQPHYAAMVDDYTEKYKANYVDYSAHQRQLPAQIDEGDWMRWNLFAGHG